MEPDVAVGQFVCGVPSVVGAVVAPGAEEYAVGEVGPAAFGPRFLMVRFTPRRGDRAPLGAAPPVAEPHRLALGRVVEPPGAAEVEDLALAAEHDRDDAR